jgi:hypothetical protein
MWLIAEPRERNMAAAPGTRPHVCALELDPGMCRLIARALRQSDGEHGWIALLAQQAVEDERACETRRAVGAEAERSIDRAAQPRSGLVWTSRARETAEACGQSRERLAGDPRSDGHEAAENAEAQQRLASRHR